MSYRMCLAIGVLLLVGAVSSLDAQEVSLEAGSRVRVKAPPSHPDWVTGVVSGYPGGSLALAPEESRSDSLLILGRDQLAELEVYRGRKSAAGKGALIGLASGAVIGIGVAFIGCEGWREDCVFDADSGEVALGFGLVFGAIGAGLGSLIGLAAGTDDWEAVPMDQLRISFRTDPAGRVALALSAYF